MVFSFFGGSGDGEGSTLLGKILAQIEYAGPNGKHGDSPEDRLKWAAAQKKLPSLHETRGIENVGKTGGRVLNEYGKFVLSIAHPFFSGRRESEFVTAGYDRRWNEVA
jgi:hypothetical protein